MNTTKVDIEVICEILEEKIAEYQSIIDRHTFSGFVKRDFMSGIDILRTAKAHIEADFVSEAGEYQGEFADITIKNEDGKVVSKIGRTKKTFATYDETGKYIGELISNTLMTTIHDGGILKLLCHAEKGGPQ